MAPFLFQTLLKNYIYDKNTFCAAYAFRGNNFRATASTRLEP